MIASKCKRTDAHLIAECPDYTPQPRQPRDGFSDAAWIARRVTPRQPKSVIR